MKIPIKGLELKIFVFLKGYMLFPLRMIHKHVLYYACNNPTTNVANKANT